MIASRNDALSVFGTVTGFSVTAGSCCRIRLFVLRFDQECQNRIEQQETKDKKRDAAFAMQFACQNPLIHMNGQISQRADSKRILENQDWNCNKHEHAPSPDRSQKEMTGKQAGYQDTDPRSNAAAFRRNLNHQVGQADHISAFPEDRSSRQFQNHICHVRRTAPQESIVLSRMKLGIGMKESQKQQWENCGPESSGAVEEKKTSQAKARPSTTPSERDDRLPPVLRPRSCRQRAVRMPRIRTSIPAPPT